MPILPAGRQHISAINHLKTHAYTQFAQFGQEDLPDLIDRNICLVGIDERAEPDTIWGFVAIQLEPRPVTLPAHAPDRAYVRAILLVKRRSPSADTAALLTAALDRLRSHLADGAITQVILQIQGHWFKAPLVRSGFGQIDAVRYYKYTAATTPPAPEPAQLTMAGPADLPILACLDAQAFPPIWHMDEGALAGLFFSTRMRVARLGEDVVGYAALSLNGAFDDPESSTPSAFLARLAVHPSVQGQGIGRQLLADSIAYAHSQQHNPVYLNTQVSNTQSQRLYEGMGFRTMNQVFQVYVVDISTHREAK